jgi:hypothetical protein
MVTTAETVRASESFLLDGVVSGNLSLHITVK